MHRTFLALLLPACGPNAGDLDLAVALHADVPTLVEVSWSTDAPGTSWVEYAEAGAATRLRTPETAVPSTAHAFVLVGMPPLSEVEIRAVTEVDGERLEGTATIETGGVPSDLPDFSVNTFAPGLASSDSFALGTVFGPLSSVYAVNRDGEWLWYHRAQESELMVQAEFEEGSANVLYNAFSPDFTQDESHVYRVSFDGTVAEAIRTPKGHHAFTQLGGGRIAYIAVDDRLWFDPEEGEEISVVGDAVVVVETDGSTSTLFSTWDWSEPYHHAHWDRAFYPQGADWTHGNWLTYYPETGTLLLSLCHVETVLELDAETGAVLREFGGLTGYGFEEGSRAFTFQHAAGWTPEGTLLLTSRVGARPNEETVALEYAVDDAARTLREIWSYGDGLGLDSIAEPSVVRLENGNTIMNWGAGGTVHEVTSEGEVAWSLSTSLSNGMGHLLLFDDFYTP